MAPRWLVVLALFVLFVTLAVASLTGMAPQDLKAYVEVVAIIGAGLYFLFRAKTGFFLINVSLHVECARIRKNDSEDYLVCTIHLKKGERGTLQIHDVLILIKGFKIVRLKQMQRLSWTMESKTSHRQDERAKIDWRKRSSEAPFLHMTPGEEAEFAWYTSVPRSEIYLVQTILLVG